MNQWRRRATWAVTALSIIVGMSTPTAMSVSAEANEVSDGAPVATRLSAGGTHTCAIVEGGRVTCWGSNSHHKLGTGNPSVDPIGDEPGEMGDALVAVDLGTGLGGAPLVATSVSAGGEHTCAILLGGSVKCWGWSHWGRLGDGLGDLTRSVGDDPDEMGNALPTVPLGTGRTAVAISAGSAHTCAILDDGSLKCWGRNDVGQLGLGDDDDRGVGPGEMGDALPAVALGSGRTAVAVSAGEQHTCAILDNGAVKCWGVRLFGRLGTGSGSGPVGDEQNEMGGNLPAVPIGSGRTATAVAAGSFNTCVLLDDGSVKCWGRGNEGVNGNESTDDIGDDAGEVAALDPIPVSGDGPAVGITMGSGHACALAADGGVRCWGTGDRLGTGYKADENVGSTNLSMAFLPTVSLGSGRRVIGVTAGALHTCAVLDDSTLRCWGLAQFGRLGDGQENTRGDLLGEMGDNMPVVDPGGKVAPVGVQVTLTAAKTSVVAGERVAFTATVTNNGLQQLRSMSMIVPGIPGCTLSRATLAVGVSRSTTCQYTTTTADIGRLTRVGFVTAETQAVDTSDLVFVTVERPVRKPDAQIRLGTGRTIGNNVYNGTGKKQTISTQVAARGSSTFRILVQNDGNTSDEFTLVGTPGNADFTVIYLDGSTNITAAVVAGTYSTGRLGVGRSATISVTITAKKSAAAGESIAALVTATSVNRAASLDAVKAVLTRR